jgi:putative transposase
MMEYGRKVIEVDRWFPSSKLCSNCGYKKDDLTLKDK